MFEEILLCAFAIARAKLCKKQALFHLLNGGCSIVGPVLECQPWHSPLSDLDH
jgi:hypothetical protein